MSSEESDSDADIPEVAVCQRLCEEFAEITGTDTACAQFYLQDRKWNLDVINYDFHLRVSYHGCINQTFV